jgi:hypothetical protein
MPRYEITSPTGQRFEINAPDGATQEQVLEYAKSQFTQMEQPKEQKEPGRLAKGVSAMTNAFLQPGGGPVSALMAGASEGWNTINDAINKGAYIAGDKASEAATAVGARPEVAGAVGTGVNALVQAVPMVVGGEAAKVAAPMLQSGARNLMQSALKPTLKALRTGKAATAIDTMLAEGVNATHGGVMQLKSKISDLNREISQAIGNSPATIDRQQAAKELLNLTQRFQKQVSPNADVAAIKGVWDEFMNHPLVRAEVGAGGALGADEIPVQLAQQLKQGTYRALSDKYGELGSATTEAQKTLARGLKHEIAAAVPEVRALNAQESKLLDALSVAERRVLMDANKNPAGLSLLAGHKGAFAAFLADRSPLFKSLIARMMNAGSEQIPANAARVGIGLTTMDR